MIPKLIHTVTVVATDGDADEKNITVTVHVLPRNEPPKILDGPREMSHWERDRENKNDGADDDSILDYRQLDTDLDTIVRDEATYTAFNPEFEQPGGG